MRVISCDLAGMCVCRTIRQLFADGCKTATVSDLLKLPVCLASDRQLFVLVLLSLARAFHRWSDVTFAVVGGGGHQGGRNNEQ